MCYSICLQAAVVCTPAKSIKVVAGLAIVAVIQQAIVTVVENLIYIHLYFVIREILFLVLPLAALVVNLVVACEARRASNRAADDLGRQQSQQATFSNSARLTACSLCFRCVRNLLDFLQLRRSYRHVGHYFSCLRGLLWHTFHCLHYLWNKPSIEAVHVPFIWYCSWSRLGFQSSRILLQLLRVSDHRQAVSLWTAQSLLSL